PGALDVGQLLRCRAHARVVVVRADRRAADHDEAPVRQPPRELEEKLRAFAFADAPDPEHRILPGTAPARRQLVAARDQRGGAAEVALTGLELQAVLHHDVVDAPQPALIEHAVARV